MNDIKRIEITFPAAMPHIDPAFVTAIHGVAALAGPCTVRAEYGEETFPLRTIAIQFHAPIARTPASTAVVMTLTSLASFACEAYERAHPEQVCWPAFQGSKPLGSIYREGTPFDDEVYLIDCEAMPDATGRNPNNPRQAELQASARAERDRRRMEL